MDSLPYLQHLEVDAAALAAAVEGDPAAPVPSCPGWTVDDLVTHTGAVHRWVTEIVETRATERPPREEPGPLPAGGLRAWFEEGAARLLAALHDADAAEPIWNWTGIGETVAFWHRRMAQETAVHRWDGEHARGKARAIDAALAVDGIEEVFGIFLPRALARGQVPAPGGSLRLTCSDAEGDWLVRVEAGRARLGPPDGAADVTVRGSASDLLLFSWGRPPPGELEVSGDRAVLAQWQERLRF